MRCRVLIACERQQVLPILGQAKLIAKRLELIRRDQPVPPGYLLDAGEVSALFRLLRARMPASARLVPTANGEPASPSG